MSSESLSLVNGTVLDWLSRFYIAHKGNLSLTIASQEARIFPAFSKDLFTFLVCEILHQLQQLINVL